MACRALHRSCTGSGAMPIAHVCEFCKNTFMTKANRKNARFCNHTCQRKYTENKNTRTCLTCGSSFVSSMKRQTYCSEKCSHIGRTGKPQSSPRPKEPHVVKICTYCNKEYSVIFHKRKRSKFCSSKCVSDYISSHPKREISFTENISSVREMFNYDPVTGVIKWAKSPGRNITAGRIAGRKSSDGYITICFKGRDYKAQYIAYAIHYGIWPTQILDHENGVRSDNSIKNLRPADNIQNGHNCKSRNALGIKGIYPRGNGYRSMIRYNKELIHLGTFSTADAALEARIVKEKELGIFEFCESSRRRPISY